MNKSPKAPKKESKELTFTEAIQEVLTGKSITKLEWGDKKYYGLLKDGQLMLRKLDNQYYQWILSEGDMRGEDWVVI